MSDIATAIIEQAESRGFKMPKVVEIPELPPDVTTVSPSELMRLMTAYTALKAYAATEDAIAFARATSSRAFYKQERAKKYIFFKEDRKLTEKHRDYLLDEDDTLNELLKEQVAAESYQKMVTALLSGFEGKYNLLSRELTRRGIAAENRFD